MLLARGWSRKPFLATWHYSLPVTRLQGPLRLCSLSIVFYMVGAVRLELTTYRLKADYSSQLSYAPIRLPLLSLSIGTLLFKNFCPTTSTLPR